MKTPYNWINNTGNLPSIVWGNNPYTWGDVAFVMGVLEQGGIKYLEKHQDEKKKFIKLLCKVKGIEFDETKEIKKTKIFIEDIQLVAKEVANIDLKVNI